MTSRFAPADTYYGRRPYRGRQVLKPGKRKAALHPWAARLWASRNGMTEAELVALAEVSG